MAKRSIAIVIVLTFLFSTIVFGATGNTNAPGLQNFTKSNATITFTDISGWYTQNVVDAAKYGIMNGVGNNQFNPNGNLTVAEAVVIAAKINAIYQYGTDATNELNQYSASQTTWYGEYWDYCMAENLFESWQSDYLTRPITRAQMVHLWSKVISSNDLPKQNTVKNLPDVSIGLTDYSTEIMHFYEYGITSGTDTIGTFNPNANITRAEAATMLLNLIEPQRRTVGKTYNTPTATYTPLNISDETRAQLALAGYPNYKWSAAQQTNFETVSQDRFSVNHIFLGNNYDPVILFSEMFFEKNGFETFQKGNYIQNNITVTRWQALTLWRALDESIIHRPIMVNATDIKAKDISGNPLESSILYCIQRGYIPNDDMIYPDNNVSKFDLSIMGVKALLTDNEIDSLLKDITNFQPKNPDKNDNIAYQFSYMNGKGTLYMDSTALYDLRTNRPQELPWIIAANYLDLSAFDLYQTDNVKTDFFIKYMVDIIRVTKGVDFLKESVIY